MNAEVAALARTEDAAAAAAKAKRADGMRADARRNNQRLLAAAADAFAERGGDDVSLEEIARRAGVGIGTLYRHFPTRQALLEAVYRDQVDALGVRASELIRAEEPAAALAEWVAALVTFGKAKRSLTTALLEHLDKDSELLSSSRDVLHGATDALLERAQRARVARTDVSGSDVIRLVHGVSIAADMGQDPGQADRMLALVLDGLLSPADRRLSEAGDTQPRGALCPGETGQHLNARAFLGSVGGMMHLPAIPSLQQACRRTSPITIVPPAQGFALPAEPIGPSP